MSFTELLNLTEEYVDSLGEEIYQMVKKLKKEQDVAIKKSLYREIVKCYNTKVIFEYEQVFRTAVFRAKRFTSAHYGKKNAFIDYINHNIDYELTPKDQKCLKEGVQVYLNWYLNEYAFFEHICKYCCREINKIENKYMRDCI